MWAVSRFAVQNREAVCGAERANPSEGMDRPVGMKLILADGRQFLPAVLIMGKRKARAGTTIARTGRRDRLGLATPSPLSVPSRGGSSQPRETAMLRYVSPILVATVLSSACFASDTPGLPRLPINISSHSAHFFENLLGGRVWVFNWQGAPAAIHFTREHRAFECRAGRSNTPSPGPSRHMDWRIGSPNNATSLQLTAHGANGARPTNAMVIIYDPRSGRLHAEQYSQDTEKWHVNRDGWIQDRWPAALGQICPQLSLAPGLPINENQNSLDWKDLKRAASPIRNHPGSEYSYIGATGLGASSGQPTMTRKQVENYERLMHGVIGATHFDRRFVFVRTPGGSQVWLLDDRDDIAKVGTVTPVPGRDINVIRWRGSFPDYSYRVRFPIPVRPTPRRHPAFQMMIDLVASKRPVTLGRSSSSSATFLFHAAGKLHSERRTGTWWISEGEIKTKINDKVAGYPWRAFAEAAGWKPRRPPNSASPDRESGSD